MKPIEPCQWCEGALICDNLPYCNFEHAIPCVHCLSYRATDDVREVALAWLGFDPWDVGCGAQGCDEDRGWPKGFLSLESPSGRNLGALVLATRLDIPATQGVMLTQRARHEWDLRGSVKPGGQYPGGTPPMDETIRRLTSGLTGGMERMSHRRGMERLWVVVPALASIPDAPPNLRAARAMVLALEATEPEKHHG